MKPIKLIISAIGPYAGKLPEIEFDTFEEKGLFLISGDTGVNFMSGDNRLMKGRNNAAPV